MGGNSRRAMKWLQQIVVFLYKVQHIPGSHNIITDALSCNPVPLEGPDDSEREIIMTIQFIEGDTIHQRKQISILPDLAFLEHLADEQIELETLTKIHPRSDTQLITVTNKIQSQYKHPHHQ